MAITLQELVDEAAVYVKAELITAGSPAVYDTDSQAIVDILISGINDAKNIIVKRKYHFTTVESVTLDADSCFDTADLKEVFYKAVSIKYDDFDVPFKYENGLMRCDISGSIPVDVEYWYIPADLTELDDDYPFPDVIDYRALCYRAAQRYYEIRGGQSDQRKSIIWGTQWNDALRNMSHIKTASRQVKCIYDYGEW